MEIQDVHSEYFHDTKNSLLDSTKQPKSTSPSSSSSDDLVGSFAQLSLKSLKKNGVNGSFILPSIQVYTTKKRGNRKKKKNSYLSESIFENGESLGVGSIDEDEYKDDWSKQSCDEFFVPVESFLNTQLQREKSSKRRCKIVEKSRNIENNRKFVEDRLHEFDEKISLNTLLKQNKSCSIQVSATPMNSGQLNYRALIAEEIIRKNSHCNRCTDRNRKYEDNYFLRSISFGLNGGAKNKKKKNNPFSFPSLPPLQQPFKVFNSSQGLFSSQNYSHSQFNESSYKNFSDSSFSGEHAFKSSLNVSLNNNNSLNNSEPNPFSTNRKPFMNKSPIEIHKKNIL